MAKARGDVRYGRVVYAWLRDARGAPKLRPALILTPDDLIASDASLLVAAITTTFPSPPPQNHVVLPWHPKGNVMTRLTRRSAVVVDWQATISADEIVGYGGDVPGRILLQVERLLDQLED